MPTHYNCLPHLDRRWGRTTRLTVVNLIMVLLMAFALVLLMPTPTLPLWFVIALISAVGRYTIRICRSLLLTRPVDPTGHAPAIA